MFNLRPTSKMELFKAIANNVWLIIIVKKRHLKVLDQLMSLTSIQCFFSRQNSVASQARKFLFSTETNDRYRNFDVTETMETNFCFDNLTVAITTVTMNKVFYLIFSFRYLLFHFILSLLPFCKTLDNGLILRFFNAQSVIRHVQAIGKKYTHVSYLKQTNFHVD